MKFTAMISRYRGPRGRLQEQTVRDLVAADFMTCYFELIPSLYPGWSINCLWPDWQPTPKVVRDEFPTTLRPEIRHPFLKPA